MELRYNNKQIIEHIVLNTYKMLSARNKIKDSEINEYYNDTISQFDYISNEVTYKGYYIKVFFEKINKITRINAIKSVLDDELLHKIIIVYDTSLKIFTEIIKNANTEVFFIHELMINLIDHDLVPQHEVLNNDEKQKFLQEYKVKGKELPRILLCDPIVRYYNLSPGTILRITRPSIASGESIFYRIVHKSSYDILFD